MSWILPTLIILIIFCRFSHSTISFFKFGSQNCMQCSKCGRFVQGIIILSYFQSLYQSRDVLVPQCPYRIPHCHLDCLPGNCPFYLVEMFQVHVADSQIVADLLVGKRKFVNHMHYCEDIGTLITLYDKTLLKHATTVNSINILKTWIHSIKRPHCFLKLFPSSKR